MIMINSLRKLTYGLLAAFTLVALTLGYWVIVRGESLLAREDNPRRVLNEQRIRRGLITDRNGNILAETLVGYEGDITRRSYPYPEAAPVVGYYSLRYGASGVEAAYDSLLRGDSLLTAEQRLVRDLLHRPQTGGDVQLTLDLAVQQAVARAMQDHRGAVVVLSVPSGDILAMVSQPSYDPASLDENWDALVANTDAPLLNRVTQGLYQPGTILQSILLGAALNAGVSSPDDAWTLRPTVSINGTTLPCAGQESGVQTLAEAYIQGCPAPFQTVASRLGTARLGTALEDFGLLEPPAFVLPTESRAQDATSVAQDHLLLGAGQSDLTLSPLQMVLVAASFSDHGQIPVPRLIKATRQPGSGWREVVPEGYPRGTISRANAEAVAALMAEAVNRGAAQAAALPDYQVYGHAGLAITGPEDTLNAWFIGFVYRTPDEAFAAAVLLEDTAEASQAARIGGLALQAAVRSIP